MSQPGDRDALRIGTAEREEAMRLLGEHFAAGRLPMDEYEKRVTAILEAQIFGEVRPLFADLPAPRPAFLAPPPAVRPRGQLSIPQLTEDETRRVAAGVVQIVVPLGIGRFILGDTRIAVLQMVLVLVGIGVIWSIVDGILILVGVSQQVRQREQGLGSGQEPA